MGYIRNHAIVVTATYGDHIERAHAEASRIFPWVSPISPKGINGTRSFFIPPDGSKEGLDESDLGDVRRKEFKRYLCREAFTDGSVPFDWIEVAYGGDDVRAFICGSSKRYVGDFCTRQG